MHIFVCTCICTCTCTVRMYICTYVRTSQDHARTLSVYCILPSALSDVCSYSNFYRTFTLRVAGFSPSCRTTPHRTAPHRTALHYMP
ncbi:hypothetical protein IWX48DRAFT_608713 [Phyllosticta citricarpa]